MSSSNTGSAARPKRNAEAHGRYASPSNKKPRFDYRNPSTLAPDAPEEDAILELDEIGKGGQQTKRNAVNLDGYDTDSSTENFDTRAEAKAKLAKQEGRQHGLNGSSAEKGGAGWNARAESGKSKDEEQNDMFADVDEDMQGGGGDGDEDEELSREGKKKKKDVRFVDMDEIQGQVHSSKSGGHVSADFNLGVDEHGQRIRRKDRDEEVESSSESGGDEERDQLDPEDEDAEEVGAGAKKRHAPKLDAFNMAQEGEEGKFDDSGNYVRKATDPDAVHDNWLDGLNKKDMKKAREAQEKRDADRRAKAAEDDALLTSDLLGALILRLEKGETTLEALQRLGGGKKRKQQPKWKKRRKDEMDVDVEKEEDNPAEVKRKEAVDAITGAADRLFSRDQPEVYEHEREVLMRQYKRETGEDWVDSAAATRGDDISSESRAAAADRQWEYRWSDVRDGGESHGPYDGTTMQAWNEAGYFGEGVEFRRIGESDWSRAVVDF